MADHQQRLEDIEALLNTPNLPDDIRSSLFREGGELWVSESRERFSWGVEEPWMEPVRQWRRMGHDEMVASVQRNKRSLRKFLDTLEDVRRGWKWDPTTVFSAYLSTNLVADAVVADVGCGYAHLATRLQAERPDITVRSFDLVGMNERVEVADAAHLPLDGRSLDAVVMGCSLWGDRAAQLAEAHRTLRVGGLLLVAEPESHWRQGRLNELLEETGFAFTPTKADSVSRFIYTVAVKTAVL